MESRLTPLLYLPPARRVSKPGLGTQRPIRMMPLLKRACAVLIVAALAVTASIAQTAQEDAADAERLIRALDVKPGSIVGEVGAGGSGALTIAMAKAVGEAGRVFTNEVDTDRVRTLKGGPEKAGLKHVTVVEGRPAETNFPNQCCDAIFMRNVYHHFGDPPAMNASLRESLKPGGGWRSSTSRRRPGVKRRRGRGEDNHHGVSAPTLEAATKSRRV